MMERVLVTGGSGALGQALVPRLRQVYATATIWAPTRHDDHFDLLHLDAVRSQILTFRPSLIFHLAASYADDLKEACAINVWGADTLLSTLLAAGSTARVVLIGSAAEYGFVLPTDNPVSEIRLPYPVSVYGLTKSWQSQLAFAYATKGVDVVVARIFNLLGPMLSERLFVGNLIKQINEYRRQEREIIQLGSLSAIRDYIPIADAVEQLLAIQRYGFSGQIYNVGSGVPILMRDLMRDIIREFGVSEAAISESPSLLPGRFDVPAIYADMKKTHELLNRGKIL